MIVVSGLRVSVSVRALVNCGCSNPETMCLYLNLYFFHERHVKSELHLIVQFSSPPLRMYRLNTFLFYVLLTSPCGRFFSRNDSIYKDKVTFDDQNNLSQSKDNCLL